MNAFDAETDRESSPYPQRSHRSNLRRASQPRAFSVDGLKPELFRHRRDPCLEGKCGISHTEAKECGLLPVSNLLIHDARRGNTLPPCAMASNPIWEPALDWFWDTQPEDAWDGVIHFG